MYSCTCYSSGETLDVTTQNAPQLFWDQSRENRRRIMNATPSWQLALLWERGGRTSLARIFAVCDGTSSINQTIKDSVCGICGGNFSWFMAVTTNGPVSRHTRYKQNCTRAVIMVNEITFSNFCAECNHICISAKSVSLSNSPWCPFFWKQCFLMQTCLSVGKNKAFQSGQFAILGFPSSHNLT